MKLKKILLAVTVVVLFTVFGVASFSAPYVSLNDPSQELTKTTFNAPFTIHFSHLMNKQSVEDAWRITPSVAGHFQWPDGKTLEFHPDGDLNIGDEYQVIIKGTAKSLWMKILGVDSGIRYLVTGPPFVLFNHPADQGVIRDGGVVTVMFDRPMAFVEIAESDLILSDPETTGEIRYVGQSAFQYIVDDLKPDTDYEFMVPDNLPSLDGGKTETNTEWTLTTPSTKVESSFPEEDAEVDLNQELVVYFDEEVDLGSIRPGGNALLFPSNDLDANVNQKEDGFFNTEVVYATDEEGEKLTNVLVFKPSFPYQYNQDYRFVLKADEAFSLEEDYELHFKTIVDPEAEVVVEEEVIAEEIEEEVTEETSERLAWETGQNMDFFVRGEHPRLRLSKALSEEAYLTACPISSNDYIRINATGNLGSFRCENDGVTLEADPNFTIINLNDYFNFDWDAGVYYARLSTETEQIWTTFLVEDTSLLLKKSDQEVLVWATDVKSGDVIPEMEVELIAYDGTSLEKGLTDESGIFYSSKSYDAGMYVRAKKEMEGRSRWALVSDSWPLDELSEMPVSPAIHLLVNQQTFTPGDTIKAKGIWRSQVSHELSLPKATQLTVTLQDTRGNPVMERRVSLRRNGSFNAELSLPIDTPEGSYELLVSDINLQALGKRLDIKVEKPSSKLELEWLSASSHHSLDTTPTFMLKARHANGLPAAKAEAKYQLYQMVDETHYQNRATDYRFNSLEDECTVDCHLRKLVKEAEFEFDLDGEHRLMMTDAKDQFLEANHHYELEVTVLENKRVKGFTRHQFKVHQGEYKLGLGLQHHIFTKGQNLGAEMIAMSHDMELLEGKRAKLSLVNQKDRKTVYEDNLSSEARELILNIPLEQDLIEGIYVLKLEGEDDSGNELLAEQTLSILSENNLPLVSGLMLASDQTRYLVGGRADLIINEASASEDNPVPILISYERGGLLGYQALLLTQSVTKLAVPIEDNMFPHFIVKATRFDRGILPAYSSDQVKIEVENNEHAIGVDLSWEPLDPQPGEEITLTINTTNFQNTPTSAVVSLNVLQGIKPLEGLNAASFFTKMPHPIADASTIAAGNKVLSQPGADLVTHEVVAGPESIYFDPLIQTSEAGEATVTLVMPDDKKDLHFQALATRQVSHFGFATADLVMHKTLSMKPILPSFISPGDQTVFAVAVKNVSDETVDSRIEIEAENVAIRGDAARNISLLPGQQAEVGFSIFVDQEATGESLDITFTSESDTLETSLPLKQLSASIDLVENGLIEDLWSGRVLGPMSAYPGSGQLVFSLSGSPLNLAKQLLDTLESYPHESSYVLASRLMARSNMTDPENKEELRSLSFLVSDLLSHADEEGAYRFWEQAAPSPQLTAMIAASFAEAKAIGINVDSTKLNKTLAYLLRSLDENDLPLNDQLFVLWALGQHDQHDTERVLTLFKERAETDDIGRAFLMANLNQLVLAGQNSSQPFLERLKSEVLDSAIRTENKTRFESKLATATTLYVMGSIDASNPLLSEMVHDLAGRRLDLGVRFNPMEALWMILGLNEYASESRHEPNFIAQVKLNGALVMDQSVTEQTAMEVYQSTSPASMLRNDDANDLFVKKDGAGELYFDAHLIANLDPQALKSAEDGVIITRHYLDEGVSDASTLKRGQHYTSRLELIVPKDMHHVVISEPTPAGMHAIGTLSDLAGSPFDHFEANDEYLSYFATYLPAGVYTLESEIQARVPGTYNLLPASIQEMFNSSRFARTDGGIVKIVE